MSARCIASSTAPRENTVGFDKQQHSICRSNLFWQERHKRFSSFTVAKSQQIDELQTQVRGNSFLHFCISHVQKEPQLSVSLMWWNDTTNFAHLVVLRGRSWFVEQLISCDPVAKAVFFSFLSSIRCCLGVDDANKTHSSVA